jgi:hypothetical protein
MLDRLLDVVRGGAGRALVVRGDPGVGKTALLDYLAERASGCRVARAAGVEAEMELAYAGLHQLLTPMLDRLERLPAPQRAALRTAFGLGPGSAPDRFLVGLATLSLLADAAEEQPLVCLVDDQQWLDRASAQVLGFVARRLATESIGLAAWMLDHDTDSYDKFSRAFLDGQPSGNLTRDHIVDNLTLYWLTGTGASAARWYWESGRAQTAARAAGQAPPAVSVPVAFTTFPGEIFRAPRNWVETVYPTSPTSIRLTRAATSPPGKSPSSSRARSGPRSGHCASRSEGTGAGHNLPREALQACTEALVEVDSYRGATDGPGCKRMEDAPDQSQPADPLGHPPRGPVAG